MAKPNPPRGHARPEARAQAAGLLATHRPLLEALAAALLEEETLDAGRIHEIAERFDALPPRAHRTR